MMCDEPYCESCFDDHQHPCPTCGETYCEACHEDYQRTCGCGTTYCHACDEPKECPKCEEEFCPGCAVECKADKCPRIVHGCRDGQSKECPKCNEPYCSACWNANYLACPTPKCEPLSNEVIRSWRTADKFDPPSTAVLCTAKAKSGEEQQRVLFAMSDPSKLGSSEKAEYIDEQLVEEDTRKLLNNRTLIPGEHAKGYDPVPVKGKQTKTDQRETIQKLGGKFTCHTCGAKHPAGPETTDGKSLALDKSNKVYGYWIADHQPPKKLVKELIKPTLLKFDTFKQPLQGSLIKLSLDTTLGALQDFNDEGIRLYPHCGECSRRQSSLTRAVKSKIKAAMQSRKLHTKQPNVVLQAYQELKDAVQPLLDEKLIRTSHNNAISVVGDEKAATKPQKRDVNRIGGNTAENNKPGAGCHSCGCTEPRDKILWTADHQPPTALYSLGLREGPQRLYPQCLKCSTEQSSVTNAISKVFAPGLDPEYSVKV
jgi:hypothetical protein